MGLFTFFDRFRGSGSSNASGGDRSPWGDFSFESVSARTSSGMRVSPDSALRLAAVYACVRILAETIASLPLVVYQRRPDGGKDRVTDHWLYRVAQYCDQLVPNGLGGFEPRFTCNLYLQTREQAYKVVQDMASIFRGMVYWSGGAITVTQDAPSDAV